MNLRNAKPDDLDFILALEARPEYRDLIYRWPRERHLAALEDPEHLHLLAEAEGGPLGFAILSGLTTPERSVELRRIALADPGRGLGRAFLQAVIRKTFEELKAARLWLDVFADNARARAAYRRAGFVEDGTENRVDWRDAPLVVMSISAGDDWTPVG